MDNETKNRDAELDDFWNIESLLPKSKSPATTAPAPAPRVRTETVEIELAPPVREDSAAVTQDAPLSKQTREKYAPPCVASKSESAPDMVYSPKHPLISQVRVYHWRSSFRFYERFCAMAAQLFDRSEEKCESVPFFSYMPQYDQMNRAQLAWYLYWRDRARHGEYLDTDYSYIFLYLFEIINLPGKIAPAEGQKLLCRIWRRYRKDFPLLNRYLADWICDYSLIHGLLPPADELSGSLRIISEHSTFKEFYACPTGDDAVRDAHIYLLFCTNYDYRKSKLYIASRENAAAMDTHIPGVLCAVLHALNEEGKAPANIKMQKATLSRDSFIGALCSGEMKKRIEVDYCSFQRSHELRFLITDVIKYTENKLRARLGVKSKLTIYALPDNIKQLIDAYFAKEMPSRAAVAPARPDYEALYDLPTTTLSPERAAEIEQSSWDITERLLEAFEQAPERETAQVEPNEPTEPQVKTPSAEKAQGSLPHLPFLKAVLHGDAKEQKRVAQLAGLLPDAIVEQINEAAFDLLGDIVIEQADDGSYTVIEDYEQDVKKILDE